MSTILRAPVAPYPLATKSQEVIPHEITAPAGCYKIAIPAGAFYVLENVPRVPLLAIVSDFLLLAVFTDELTMPSVVEGESIKGGMVCMPGITSIALPDTANLILQNEEDDEAVAYVQMLHSWNILGTAQQVTRI